TIDFRGRTPKKLGMDWSDSGYLALSALNVRNGYIDPSTDAHYGDQELYDKWMTGKDLYKGQVLFTTEAPMGNVAQVPDNNKYILSQRTIAFDVNSDKITDDFLAVLLRSPKSFNELSSLASGGTAKGVSQKSLSHFKVTLPNNLEEQNKIGTFFKQLDDTIALHQRELDLLRKTKQTYLQKMFPKTGEDRPEIRFAGFTEPWEQSKLNGVSDIYDGTHQTPKYQDEGVRFLSVENIKTLISNKFISHEAFESEFRIRPQRGDVLMTRIGDVGTANVVETDEDLAYYVSLALLKFEKLNSYFLQASIHAPFVQKQIC
ncbi:restriction endonuclease subunit S, partial [Escherichia coli]|uniref:restriction endonuclease subunit S n=1 Tax=Escherichia coli TaxID=562 RepID=UPI003D799B46